MATQSLVTTVSGGYNGGATISILLDSNLVFITTATDTYNLNYPVTSGSFNSILGNIDITIIPPSSNASPLYITFGGNYTETLTVNHNGQNTSYGYNYTHTSTLETVDPEPEPEPEPEPTPDNFSIILCINNSEKQAINKNLSNNITFTGSLRGESSVINPSFLLETDNPSGYNYCHIPEFGRYYFINNITSVRTGIWRIDCEVDVLMSFASEILALNVIVSDNSGFDTERYFSGNPWQTLVKTKTDVINFPSGLLDNGEYILITSGGVAT